MTDETMAGEQAETKMSGPELAEFVFEYLPGACVAPEVGVPVFGPAFVRLGYGDYDGYLYPDVRYVPSGWGLVVWALGSELAWDELNPEDVATLRGMTPAAATAQLRVWEHEWPRPAAALFLHARAYHQWRDVWGAAVRVAVARNGHKAHP
jgi:hypothetical protein